jgi:hypothetical protein
MRRSPLTTGLAALCTAVLAGALAGAAASGPAAAAPLPAGVAGPAAAAPAGDPGAGGRVGPIPDPTWMICPGGGAVREGALTSVTGDTDRVHLTGWVQPCKAARATDVAAVVAYGPGHYQVYGPIRYPLRPARVTIDGAARLSRSMVAVCLVTQRTVRLDCYGVRYAERPDGGAFVVTGRIPTTDRRVNQPVELPKSLPFPGCSNCWNLL